MAHPEKISFIRHAEKPMPPVKGVDENGASDDESLTARGWQRAGALAVSFRSDPRLALPTAIFAPGTSPENPSKRALQTVAPLAAVLGLPIDSSQTKPEFQAMLAKAMATPGVVLVSWEHKVLGASLAAAGLGADFAVEGDIPAAWPDDRFDVVWLFERIAHDRYRFSQIPELLLSGDSSQPIA